MWVYYSSAYLCVLSHDVPPNLSDDARGTRRVARADNGRCCLPADGADIPSTKTIQQLALLVGALETQPFGLDTPISRVLVEESNLVEFDQQETTSTVP